MAIVKIAGRITVKIDGDVLTQLLDEDAKKTGSKPVNVEIDGSIIVHVSNDCRRKVLKASVPESKD